MKKPSPATVRSFGLTCFVCATACLLVTVAALRLVAQSTAGPSDLAGVWGPYRGGRGADPALAPPPAGPIVLKPEYAKPYEARRAAEAAATRRGEPLGTASTLCVPYGMPRMMSVAIYPIEIIPTARQMTIIAEAFSEVRRVYLNETQASIEDVPPGYYGQSVGRWEGETLVIDTVGIKPSVAGYQDLPHSPQMRITERLKLVAPDILHDRIVIEDPVVLERPVTYTLAYRRLTDYKMVEFVCDNNREYVDQDGVVRMKLRDR